MSEESKTSFKDLKLSSREEVSKVLAATENLEFVDLKPGDDINVEFGGNKDNPIVNFQNRELAMDEEALISMAGSVGIPRSYVKKCPANLLFPHLNFWFGEGQKHPIRAVVANNRVLRSTTDRVKSRPVSNERLISLAEESIGKGKIVGYHQVSSNLDYSTVAIVTDKTFEPMNNDTLFGGVKIQNSILGKETVEVSPYVFRQWCTNGAITSESLGRYTRKRRNDNMDDWMREIIGDASHALDQEFDRIKHLTEISVKGHVPEVIKGIAMDKGIPKKITEEIIDESLSSNAETMYDIWNCITKIASHSEGLSPISISRLQSIAGSVTKDHEVCSQCHRILN